MKLIFNQGNPEQQYTKTRHNVGFFIADNLVSQHGGSFLPSTKFFADVATIQVNDEKVLVIKPTTYYNETGRSFAAVKQFYKCENDDILVIHDELALPFGTIRSRIGGSDAGNNGIKSINAHGGDTTARLRIGIGNDQREIMGDTDFVLGAFSRKEHDALVTTVLPKAIEAIEQFIRGDHAVTSHSLIPKE